MKLEFHHLIYILSLTLGITIVMENIGIFEYIKLSSGFYLAGIIVTWISSVLVYYAFLSEKQEFKSKHIHNNNYKGGKQRIWTTKTRNSIEEPELRKQRN
jgi:hypothetical protein